MSMIARAGSAAPVIGRPMTSTDAPSSSACAGVTTRFWSADVGARGPDARDDEEAVRPSRARCRNFGARADDAVEAAVAREHRKPRDLVRRRPIDTPMQARSLHRGWSARSPRRPSSAAAPPPSRPRASRGRRPRGRSGSRARSGASASTAFADRVRDVVKLQVEEDRQPELGDAPDARRALGREEFEAELHAAGMLADRFARSPARASRSGVSIATKIGFMRPARLRRPAARRAARRRGCAPSPRSGADATRAARA